MSYLNKMYGTTQVAPKTQDSNKNPNRVAGGLRGQGVDHFTMLGEDGMEKSIPSHKYVQSLEERVKEQRGAIDVLERKVNRLTKALESVEQHINKRR